MSPAKRKSAKSGRAATAAARGGKARGKARGSALTKAVKVKGKTPARRGDHRLAARSGVKVGARNGAGVACELPREQLELLLDRDGGRADVLAHVPACNPCTTSLTVIASQRDAIRHLTAEPSGTAVEYLLERGARAGERKLADLVYELAKACFARVEDNVRRVRILEQPRAAEEVGRDLTLVAGRVPSRGASLPSVAALDRNAITACQSCLSILGELEGATERHELTQAVLLLRDRRPADAEQLLTRALDGSFSREGRRLAVWNLQWALNDQRKYDHSIRLGQDALSEFENDWSITYNLAVAAAATQRAPLFRDMMRRLRAMSAPDDQERARRVDLLRFEVPRFAESLGLGPEAVAGLFGISSLQRVESHEIG